MLAIIASTASAYSPGLSSLPVAAAVHHRTCASPLMGGFEQKYFSKDGARLALLISDAPSLAAADVSKACAAVDGLSGVVYQLDGRIELVAEGVTYVPECFERIRGEPLDIPQAPQRGLRPPRPWVLRLERRERARDVALERLDLGWEPAPRQRQHAGPRDEELLRAELASFPRRHETSHAAGAEPRRIQGGFGKGRRCTRTRFHRVPFPLLPR